MRNSVNYLIISILLFVSNTVAHSEHANHTENATSSGQSAASSLMSGYPDSTVLIGIAELTVGVSLAAIAIWHFKKTS